MNRATIAILLAMNTGYVVADCGGFPEDSAIIEAIYSDVTWNNDPNSQLVILKFLKEREGGQADVELTTDKPPGIYAPLVVGLHPIDNAIKEEEGYAYSFLAIDKQLLNSGYCVIVNYLVVVNNHPVIKGAKVMLKPNKALKVAP
jgi:hypothetical protein